ncbi:hypothetical protein ACHAXA_007659, partial [Cyclostephanos tholiformis]
APIITPHPCDINHPDLLLVCHCYLELRIPHNGRIDMGDLHAICWSCIWQPHNLPWFDKLSLFILGMCGSLGGDDMVDWILLKFHMA